MKGHGAKFGRKKEAAIAALLSSKSVDDAAHAIGVNPNTLLRWLQVPEFHDADRKARREAVQQSVARLQQATGAAGITILKLMTDTNVPPAVDSELRSAFLITRSRELSWRILRRGWRRWNKLRLERHDDEEH